MLAMLHDIYTQSTTTYWEGEFDYQTTRGVQEGCPMSPTLFVFYYNIFFEELKGKTTNGSTRTLDDVAQVVKDPKEAREVPGVIHGMGTQPGFAINAFKDQAAPMGLAQVNGHYRLQRHHHSGSAHHCPVLRTPCGAPIYAIVCRAGHHSNSHCGPQQLRKPATQCMGVRRAIHHCYCIGVTGGC